MCNFSSLIPKMFVMLSITYLCTSSCAEIGRNTLAETEKLHSFSYVNHPLWDNAGSIDLGPVGNRFTSTHQLQPKAILNNLLVKNKVTLLSSHPVTNNYSLGEMCAHDSVHER